jgi:cysteine desulfurase
VLLENELALCIADAYPVTPGHSLVIPRRHLADGLALHQPEWNAVVELLKLRREQLSGEDAWISAWQKGHSKHKCWGHRAIALEQDRVVCLAPQQPQHAFALVPPSMACRTRASHHQWRRYTAKSTAVLALIYLDNNATTRPRQVVVEALAEAELRYWGNSASPHRLGREAKRALQAAKHSIGAHLGCRANELVLTSGATESNNLALAGVFEAEQFLREPRKRILLSAIEHPSVLEVAESLRSRGALVEEIEVDAAGRLNVEDLRTKLTQDTLLVSVMAANNEVGTLQPIAEIAKACQEVGAFYHTDATQWLGRLPINVAEWGVDMLSASAHKLHGPKGVGLLFARAGLPISEQQHGGGHQDGKRSGTVDVPRAVAFARALQAGAEKSDWEPVRVLRERLFAGLEERAAPVQRVSPVDSCLANTLTMRFNGIDSEALMASAPSICCSPGSACSHATPKPSHVLIAMGLDAKSASECLRFSLSQTTTAEEIDQAIHVLSEAAGYVRSVLEEAD